MTEHSTHTIERIARVLAGERLSANAEGAEPSAGGIIDQRWPEYRDEAVAVLKSLRDPPPEIEAVIARETWLQAIAAALGEETGGEETGGELTRSEEAGTPQPETTVEEVTKSVSHFLRAPS